MSRIYLDNAASTNIDLRVFNAMEPFLKEFYGNPSSVHADGRKTRAAIENARKIIASKLNASIGEIFFTSCGTESNNMALKCSVRDLNVTRIISSKMEHHCILHTLDHLEKFDGVKVDYIAIDEQGRPSLSDLKLLLDQPQKGKTLVSLMHGNNEVGTMIDLVAFSELCAEKDVYFHSDTVQTIGKFPIDLDTTKLSFVSGSAHKFHGPKGAGFIYINRDNMIEPFINGGAQERNMRAGTENLPGIVGLAEAFRLAVDEQDERRKKIESIKNYFIDRLEKEFPNTELLGDPKGNSLYTVLSVLMPQTAKSDMLVFGFDMAGISVSGGSACSSGAEHRSHVLDTILPSDKEEQKAIRFSFSHYNSVEEVDVVLEKLKTLL